jgi:hypothetical protein
MDSLRQRLVSLALEWEQVYGVAPHITAALAEHDPAQLLECPEDEYCSQMKTRTAVSRGHDFVFQGKRYQVKANRPSGKPGSFVTLVAKPKNYDWDMLIWILYDPAYRVQEAWLWEVDAYRERFAERTRISPKDMRGGIPLQPPLVAAG